MARFSYFTTVAMPSSMRGDRKRYHVWALRFPGSRLVHLASLTCH